MTAVLSGTNGLLQSYDYQTPTTGFSYTFAAGTQVLVMNPAGTLATGTITMPASPADGMTITFSSSQQITALTMSGNGASISSAVTFLPAKGAAAYIYRLANTTWYPIETVPGNSQIVSGTAVTLTTQTNVDFSNIPSWAKRITICINAASFNVGSGDLYVYLGYGATPTYETANYIGNSCQITSAAAVGFNGNITTAFLVARGTAAAADTLSGVVVLANVSGNIWTAMGNISRNGNQAVNYFAGTKTISGGALSAIRLASATITDTFDAGSINILYE